LCWFLAERLSQAARTQRNCRLVFQKIPVKRSFSVKALLRVISAQSIFCGNFFCATQGNTFLQEIFQIILHLPFFLQDVSLSLAFFMKKCKKTLVK